MNPRRRISTWGESHLDTLQTYLTNGFRRKLIFPTNRLDLFVFWAGWRLRSCFLDPFLGHEVDVDVDALERLLFDFMFTCFFQCVCVCHVCFFGKMFEWCLFCWPTTRAVFFQWWFSMDTLHMSEFDYFYFTWITLPGTNITSENRHSQNENRDMLAWWCVLVKSHVIDPDLSLVVERLVRRIKLRFS